MDESSKVDYCVIDFSYYLRENENDIFVKELDIHYPGINFHILNLYCPPEDYSAKVRSDLHHLNLTVLQQTRVGIPLQRGEGDYSEVNDWFKQTALRVKDIYIYGSKKTNFVRRIIQPSVHCRVHNIKPWFQSLERAAANFAATAAAAAAETAASDSDSAPAPKRQRLHCEVQEDKVANINLSPCIQHKTFSVECGIVNDFTPRANSAFCSNHPTGSIAICPLKRALLYGLYIKSEKQGCKPND
jgi:hypothetical protein